MAEPVLESRSLDPPVVAQAYGQLWYPQYLTYQTWLKHTRGL